MIAKTVEKRLDPTRPVAVWSSLDLLEGRPVKSLTVILRTVGCRWNRCTMCGYASEGAPATAEDLMVQFYEAMKKLSSETQVVKIYTSGSFLDPLEVPQEVRGRILDDLHSRGIKKLVIESRPGYITPELVAECLSNLDTEFAIGLETANDLIRENIIHKGFTFSDFARASQIIHSQGGRVKAYLLLKAPMLSEGAAIRDAISSAKAASLHADMLSLNLCNVQRGTLVERLWERGEYRPPWLWSALEVLKNVPHPIICDPVGAGTRRGPHNCGNCDADIAKAIRSHDLTQDAGIFDDLECKCKSAWRMVVELEEQTFGTPLV
jgi:radical SAM enzyme (TIGR01210 family)